MPTYEAVCSKCGKLHEYKSSIGERLEKRPMCCGKQTEGTIRKPPMGYVVGPAAGK